MIRKLRRYVSRFIYEMDHPHARYARLHRKYERLLKGRA